ncbi:lysophospholipid acyltransferase 2b [Maylandia zebra]|uniref:Lysophospholipid acyltransferase 2b isoform X1 n=3 Tax=Haplochromini TaxID=319058 RepID=A0A9Y3R6U7_9CICH|nr:lysophospholipid acyltransferase 2 [Maylandia zebra]XP_005732861.1 PREDICTED: lysophospholipid acyltransferase 2-like isoform X1 [Pundamilia nyererei]XP_026050736.1 lysophospholipid acyltransferase 2-like [Astatotilapia calliptera]
MADDGAPSTACTGSSLLQPLSELTDLPLDQVNFVACQLCALISAFWFRLFLHPSKTSPIIRHVVATLLGLYFAMFCFGWYALHFLVQSGLTYGIMILTGVEHMHKYCLVVALTYLSLCQITRVYVFDYGMYTADFTGPMMVITQKITSLAFEIHDGMARKEEHLTAGQKILAIRRMPSLLEYFSYNCNFMGILAGPTCSYNDYIGFIEGAPRRCRDYKDERKSSSKLRHSEPSPNMEVVRKVTTSFFCLLVFLSVCKVFPVERNIDDNFIANTPFYAQVVYLYLSMLTTRPKYYFVWTLADAINNAAGFGFNGYDSDGSARWDLISNLRILKIEFATSFKVFLDNWNIQTAHWLKRVCYERCPYHPTAATFILSAMWHGAYPGYYLTFLTGIVITLAARAVRHNVRPYFLHSSVHKLVYDVITWAATQIAICYTVIPFVLLSVGPSMKFYSSWYFSLHIGCILVAFVLPVKRRNLPLKDQQKSPVQESLQRHLEATDRTCSQKAKTT